MLFGKSEDGAYKFQGTGRRLLLVCVLHEEEQPLSGHARPGSNGVGVLGVLLAAQELAQARGRDGLLAEPEVLLRVAEKATRLISAMF